MLIKPETRIIPGSVPRKFFMQHLKPYSFFRGNSAGKRVLEIGSGDGYGGAYLAETALSVICVDYDSSVIERARKKYRAANLSFVNAPATLLPFPDASFDIICSFQVIEHIPENDLHLYLEEIRRLLAANGICYLSTLNLENAVKSEATYTKHPAHCKEFVLRELEALLKEVFNSVSVLGVQPTAKHYFYQKLKKTGLFRFLPGSINPVTRFYAAISTDDFVITGNDLRKSLDFFCICSLSA